MLLEDPVQEIQLPAEFVTVHGPGCYREPPILPPAV
jgi:hypothetical protein